MSEQQVQKVRVKRLAHVGLWATDVASQTRFYRQVLGFNLRATEIKPSGEDVEFEDANTFLSLGDEHHCLGVFNDTRSTTNNGRGPVQHTHLHHIAFEVDTDAELAALAARLNQSGVELALQPRDGNPEVGDTLWFDDPDGNRIEISVTSDDSLTLPPASSEGRRTRLHPHALQHLALRTTHLEAMVNFYTEALGFDISDWLLRECVWLRCNSDHHTIVILQGKQDVDHVGYSIPAGAELLAWAEELQQYYDHDVTTPPRLWHSRPTALNLWGVMPGWVREEVRV